MDYLFHADERLDNPVSLEWVRWLIAGGRSPEEFATIGKLHCIVFLLLLFSLKGRVQQVQG